MSISVLAFRISLLSFLLFSLSACGGSSGSNGSSGTSVPVSFSLDCSNATTYRPSNPPQITPSSMGAATTTLIVMHGKTGTPNASHLQSFYTDMAAKGYDVIAPFMPWAGAAWDGTLCEAMLYIDELAKTEISAGKHVVVVGHSMGGVHALIYGAMNPSPGVQAIVAIAPGHMPHISLGFQNLVSADVSRAESMVANGQGNQVDSFITPNGGISITLTTTPNIYLSYHALDQFPNMHGVVQNIDLPVMWFAGDADNATTVYHMANLAGEITSSNSQYQLISGTHLGVVANTPTPLSTWLSRQGI